MNILSKERIIDICKEREGDFSEYLKCSTYERKGIFHSELLLVYAMCLELQINSIVESGRARGQSTCILAKGVEKQNIRVKSIELNKYTHDTIVSLNRLSELKNIELFYGDSFKMIHNLLDDSSIVLIDGPKGYDAFLLVCNVLQDNRVKAVFLHDAHKDSTIRDIIESTFPYTFFTDDHTYVSEFKHLDDDCWKEQSKWDVARDWAPYKRGEKKMQSYAATLGMIIRYGDLTNVAAKNGCCVVNNKRAEMAGTKKPSRIKQYCVIIIDNYSRIIQAPFRFIQYYLIKVKFWYKTVVKSNFS